MNKRLRMSFITAMLLFGASVNTQDAMRVHYKDGKCRIYQSLKLTA